jgi:hypothetical protein
MISLERYVQSLDFSKDLHAVNALLDLNKITPKFSFLGTREIEVKGFKGTVSLKEIEEKVLLVAEKFKNLKLYDRYQGLQIAEKINQLNESMDAQSAVSGYFKELQSDLKGIIVGHELFQETLETTEYKFLAFSKEQLIDEFGDQFDDAGNHPDIQINDSNKIFYPFADSFYKRIAQA